MHVANFHTGSGDPASREGEEERRMSLSGWVEGDYQKKKAHVRWKELWSSGNNFDPPASSFKQQCHHH